MDSLITAEAANLHAPDGKADEVGAEAGAHLHSRSRQFNRFPNAVARDIRLGPAEVVLLAFRSTKINWVLREDYLDKNPLVRTGSGLGKNAIRDAFKTARECGYLKHVLMDAPLEEILGVVATAAISCRTRSALMSNSASAISATRSSKALIVGATWGLLRSRCALALTVSGFALVL
jgi:hypothetical protein